MREPGSQPQGGDSPRNPFGDQPLPAIVIDPRPQPRHPSAPPPYDWSLLAVLSWLLASIAGLVALVMVLVRGDLRLWYWWLAVVVLLGLGYMASIVPLRTKVRPGWTGTHTIALLGLILTAMSSCWCLLCVGLVSAAAYARTPEGKAELEAFAEMPKRLEAERQAKLRREEEARQRAMEKRRIEALVKARNESIVQRDRELARRFHEGENRLPPPAIPDDPTLPPPRPGEPSHRPPPRVQPQPLVVRPVTIAPQPAQTTTEPHWFERDLRVQPLGLVYRDTLPAVLWSDSGDTAWLLKRSGVLLELDAETWRPRRELALGGPCVSLARSRSHLLVARTQPGAIVCIDPGTLAAVQEIPAAQVEEIAASPATDVVFVQNTQHYSLAVLDLPQQRIAALLTPREALRLGREDVAVHLLASAPARFRQLIASADGRWLVARGDELHRWKVQGATLSDCRDFDIHYDASWVGSGHDGLLLAAGDDVIATPTLTRVLRKEQHRWRGASFDRAGRLFAAGDTNTLVIVSPQGALLAKYDWRGSSRGQRSDFAFAAPEGQRAIVFHSEGVYGVDLPPELGGRAAPGGPQLVATLSETWMPVEIPPRVNAEPLSPRARLPGRKLTDAGGQWCWSDDGAALFWLSPRGLARLNSTTLEVERALSPGSAPRFEQLLLTQAGLIAVADAPPRLIVFDPQTLAVRRTLAVPDWLPLVRRNRPLVAAAANSKLMAGVTTRQSVRLLDLETGEIQSELSLAEATGQTESERSTRYEQIAGLAMTADGDRLFVSANGLHRLRIGAGGLEYEQSSVPMQRTSPCLISGDGRRVLLRGETGLLVFRADNLRDGVQRTPSFANCEIGSAIDRAGTLVWSAGLSANGIDQRQTASYPLEARDATDQALSPDGRRLLAANRFDAYLLEVGSLDAESLPKNPLSTRPLVAKVELTPGKEFTLVETTENLAGEPRTEGTVQLTPLNLPRSTLYDGRYWITPDGRTLYHLSDDAKHTLRRISLPGLRCERSLEFAPFQHPQGFMPAGPRLAVFSEGKGGELWLLDPLTLQPQAVFRSLLAQMAAVAGEANWAYLKVGGEMVLIELDRGTVLGSWDIASLGLAAAGADKRASRLKDIRRLLVRPDGRELITDDSSGRFRLILDGDQLRVEPGPVFPAAMEDIVWDATQLKWLAIHHGRRPSGSDGVKAEYFSFYTHHDFANPQRSLSVPYETRPHVRDLALANQHAFAFFRGPPHSLVRVPLDGSQTETFPLSFEVKKIIPSPTGNDTILITDEEILFAKLHP